jgi:hypothetical protein
MTSRTMLLAAIAAAQSGELRRHGMVCEPPVTQARIGVSQEASGTDFELHPGIPLT